MNFKEFWNSTFSYSPKDKYEFKLPDEESNNQSTSKSFSSESENVKIFPSLNVNKEFLQTKYNTLINSDIVLREFTLNARGKQYHALVIYIDGMVNSQIMDDFILKPLMLRNKNNLFDGSQNKVISEAVANNITVRKVKKFDLSAYLSSCLLPQNSIKKISTFSEATNGINSRKLCFICRYTFYCIRYRSKRISAT